MSIVRSSDVLESDSADFVREHPRLRVQWLKSSVFHFVVAEHLLHEQQRIGAHVQIAMAVRLCPFERGK